MRPLIFLFPGQSSRDAEMFARLEAIDPQVATRFATEATSRGASPPTNDSPTNLDIQLSVHAANRAWATLLSKRGMSAAASAGLSLGEYAHLVDIGAIAETDALDLVRRRGELYDAGPPGVMAALYPLDGERVETILGRVSARLPGQIAAAVYNSPSQTVVAGTPEAIEEAIAMAEEEYAAGTVIERRIPMHTPLFEAVAAPLGEALERVHWQATSKAYWPNVLGEPLAAAGAGDLVTLLARHAYEPVRWRQTIDAMVAQHPDAIFVEVGPRRVLTDLMKRRWHPTATVFALDPGADTPPERVGGAFESTIEEISHARG